LNPRKKPSGRKVTGSEEEKRQAGAGLCQAQIEPGLAKIEISEEVTEVFNFR
jgi:hypothetical protein